MADHPNKHIREALNYAEACGWTIKKAGPRAHAWGVIQCSYGHRDCRMSIWSTPRNPENHAKAIRRKVDRCPESVAPSS
jgi:hypothetical protein